MCCKFERAKSLSWDTNTRSSIFCLSNCDLDYIDKIEGHPILKYDDFHFIITNRRHNILQIKSIDETLQYTSWYMIIINNEVYQGRSLRDAYIDYMSDLSQSDLFKIFKEEFPSLESKCFIRRAAYWMAIFSGRTFNEMLKFLQWKNNKTILIETLLTYLDSILSIVSYTKLEQLYKPVNLFIP